MNSLEATHYKRRAYRNIILFIANIALLVACGGKKTPSQEQAIFLATQGASQNPSVVVTPGANAVNPTPFLNQDAGANIDITPDNNLNCETVQAGEGALAVIMRQRKEKTGNPYANLGINFVIKDAAGNVIQPSYNYYTESKDLELQPGQEFCEQNPNAPHIK